LFDAYAALGNEGLDFSAIIRHITGR